MPPNENIWSIIFQIHGAMSNLMIWIIPQHDILMFASNKYLITEFGKDLLGLCGPERENMSKNGDDPF